MAKNLIDDESLEFVEGTTKAEHEELKTDHEAAIIGAGQTVVVLPIKSTAWEYNLNTGNGHWQIYAQLPEPIIVSDYSHIRVEVFMYGIERVTGQSASAVLAWVGLWGADDGYMSAFKDFYQSTTINGSDTMPKYSHTYTDINVSENLGVTIGSEYKSGSLVDVCSKTDYETAGDVLPAAIERVYVEIIPTASYPVTTYGLVVKVTGVE